MKNTDDKEFENDLNIISNFKEVGAPIFFYTRLKARMENELVLNEATFFFKVSVAICTLTLFLFINSILLKKDSDLVNSTTNQNLEALAASYDQSI